MTISYESCVVRELPSGEMVEIPVEVECTLVVTRGVGTQVEIDDMFILDVTRGDEDRACQFRWSKEDEEDFQKNVVPELLEFELDSIECYDEEEY